MSETRCRWVSSDHPRVLDDRHRDECASDECRGCQPCTAPHCVVCGIAHSLGACAGCVADTRETLAAIAQLCHSLPAEVEVRGVEGEAMHLLGPVANAEAWLQRGRYGHRYSAEARLGENHPDWVLSTWEMLYRAEFEHDSGGAYIVGHAWAYLDQQLSRMAGHLDVPFEDFDRDLRACRAHLEAVLHAGEQIEKGAPCPECRKPLLLVYGKRLVDDRWKCQTKRCDVREYTTAQYRGWVEDDALHGADRLTAADMVLRFRDENDLPMVKAGEVRVWGSRGLVRKRGRTELGMTLYDVADTQARIEARRADHACA